MSTLIRLYRTWPLRPHCTDDHHVLLCRWLAAQEPGRYCRKYR